MAIQRSYFPILSALLCAFVWVSEAATVTYDFNITWVYANPDGMYNRPTIGINGEWPLPIITATINDTIIVNVNNQLGNQTTTLHFHGLYMYNTTEMDGPAMVSQCGIPSGSSFQYKFYVSHNEVPCNCSVTKQGVGKPIRNILVSFTRQRPIPRRSSSTIDYF
jgi:iron transport multicopper oxidase